MDRKIEKPGTTIEGDASLFKPLEIDKKHEHTEGVDWIAIGTVKVDNRAQVMILTKVQGKVNLLREVELTNS
jgi:hypothetical protein